MAKPNILFIANNNIGFGLSGGDTIFINFLKYWKKHSQLTFLACQEAIDITPSPILQNIKVILTDKINKNSDNSPINLIFHYFRRLFRASSIIFKNKNIILNHNFVYSVSDFLPDLLPAFIIKLLNPKIKWIAGYYLFAPNPFSPDSPYKKNQFIKGLFYWLIQKFTLILVDNAADYVFITSTPDSSRFKHPERTVIIKGGVDVSKIKIYLKTHALPPTRKRHFDACFFGRFHPQKGLLELIEIWNLVVRKRPKAKLAIIGQGELMSKMKQKINTFNLNKNITVFGFSTGNQLYDIFSDSKIILHPAVFDSGGMAAAEAMAFGLPGVSFDLESLKTYYPQGMIKTPCFDLTAFSLNIIHLLTDNYLYSRLSQQAKLLIKNEWDWEKRSIIILNKITKNYIQ